MPTSSLVSITTVYYSVYATGITANQFLVNRSSTFRDAVLGYFAKSNTKFFFSGLLYERSITVTSPTTRRLLSAGAQHRGYFPFNQLEPRLFVAETPGVAIVRSRRDLALATLLIDFNVQFVSSLTEPPSDELIDSNLTSLLYTAIIDGNITKVISGGEYNVTVCTNTTGACPLYQRFTFTYSRTPRPSSQPTSQPSSSPTSVPTEPASRSSLSPAVGFAALFLSVFAVLVPLGRIAQLKTAVAAAKKRNKVAVLLAANKNSGNAWGREAEEEEEEEVSLATVLGVLKENTATIQKYMCSMFAPSSAHGVFSTKGVWVIAWGELLKGHSYLRVLHRPETQSLLPLAALARPPRERAAPAAPMAAGAAARVWRGLVSAATTAARRLEGLLDDVDTTEANASWSRFVASLQLFTSVSVGFAIITMMFSAQFPVDYEHCHDFLSESECLSLTQTVIASVPYCQWESSTNSCARNSIRVSYVYNYDFIALFALLALLIGAVAKPLLAPLFDALLAPDNVNGFFDPYHLRDAMEHRKKTSSFLKTKAPSALRSLPVGFSAPSQRSRGSFVSLQTSQSPAAAPQRGSSGASPLAQLSHPFLLDSRSYRGDNIPLMYDDLLERLRDHRSRLHDVEMRTAFDTRYFICNDHVLSGADNSQKDMLGLLESNMLFISPHTEKSRSMSRGQVAQEEVTELRYMISATSEAAKRVYDTYYKRCHIHHIGFDIGRRFVGELFDCQGHRLEKNVFFAKHSSDVCDHRQPVVKATKLCILVLLAALVCTCIAIVAAISIDQPVAWTYSVLASYLAHVLVDAVFETVASLVVDVLAPSLACAAVDDVRQLLLRVAMEYYSKLVKTYRNAATAADEVKAEKDHIAHYTAINGRAGPRTAQVPARSSSICYQHQEQEQEQHKPLNAMEYFSVSRGLARRFHMLFESQLVLSFATLLPPSTASSTLPAAGVRVAALLFAGNLSVAAQKAMVQAFLSGTGVVVAFACYSLLASPELATIATAVVALLAPLLLSLAAVALLAWRRGRNRQIVPDYYNDLIKKEYQSLLDIEAAEGALTSSINAGFDAYVSSVVSEGLQSALAVSLAASKRLEDERLARQLEEEEAHSRKREIEEEKARIRAQANAAAHMRHKTMVRREEDAKSSLNERLMERTALRSKAASIVASSTKAIHAMKKSLGDEADASRNKLSDKLQEKRRRKLRLKFQRAVRKVVMQRTAVRKLSAKPLKNLLQKLSVLIAKPNPNPDLKVSIERAASTPALDEGDEDEDKEDDEPEDRRAEAASVAAPALAGTRSSLSRMSAVFAKRGSDESSSGKQGSVKVASVAARLSALISGSKAAAAFTRVSAESAPAMKAKRLSINVKTYHSDSDSDDIRESEDDSSDGSHDEPGRRRAPSVLRSSGPSVRLSTSSKGRTSLRVVTHPTSLAIRPSGASPTAERSDEAVSAQQQVGAARQPPAPLETRRSVRQVGPQPSSRADESKQQGDKPLAGAAAAMPERNLSFRQPPRVSIRIPPQRHVQTEETSLGGGESSALSDRTFAPAPLSNPSPFARRSLLVPAADVSAPERGGAASMMRRHSHRRRHIDSDSDSTDRSDESADAPPGAEERPAKPAQEAGVSGQPQLGGGSRVSVLGAVAGAVRTRAASFKKVLTSSSKGQRREVDIEKYSRKNKFSFF